MKILHANWAAPNNVHALTTTRTGGFSKPPYDSNNLALHVGDIEIDVQHNRKNLIEQLKLPSSPEWLDQTHSTRCVVIEDDTNRAADAAITRQKNTTLAILTADCLPIVITNLKGTEIAAIHAGWRGLANGIIDSTLKKMHSSTNELIAWIGPAICHQCYETGEEVKKIFINNYPFTTVGFQTNEHRLYADLPKLAELILSNAGISSISQSNQCTYEMKNTNDAKNTYYSYRNENQTGRIATLIWFNLEKSVES